MFLMCYYPTVSPPPPLCTAVVGVPRVAFRCVIRCLMWLCVSCVVLQTPNMAICDANLVDGMPKSLTAFGGLDALVHALESYVSVCSTDYTKGKHGCFVGGAVALVQEDIDWAKL